MKLPSLKKYHINTYKVSKSLSDILLVTRPRTTKMIKFWKHLWQIVRERIPVLAPFFELFHGKGLISEVHIIKYSMSWWWRVTIVCTEATFVTILLLHGRDIITEAKNNIINMLIHQQIPNYLSIETVLLMIIISIGTIAYYGMIKPGDFKQAVKEHKEEWR